MIINDHSSATDQAIRPLFLCTDFYIVNLPTPSSSPVFMRQVLSYSMYSAVEQNLASILSSSLQHINTQAHEQMFTEKMKANHKVFFNGMQANHHVTDGNTYTSVLFLKTLKLDPNGEHSVV